VILAGTPDIPVEATPPGHGVRDSGSGADVVGEILEWSTFSIETLSPDMRWELSRARGDGLVLSWPIHFLSVRFVENSRARIRRSVESGHQHGDSCGCKTRVDSPYRRYFWNGRWEVVDNDGRMHFYSDDDGFERPLALELTSFAEPQLRVDEIGDGDRDSWRIVGGGRAIFHPRTRFAIVFEGGGVLEGDQAGAFVGVGLAVAGGTWRDSLSRSSQLAIVARRTVTASDERIDVCLDFRLSYFPFRQ
jgi:hypothetical protein